MRQTFGFFLLEETTRFSPQRFAAPLSSKDSSNKLRGIDWTQKTLSSKFPRKFTTKTARGKEQGATANDEKNF